MGAFPNDMLDFFGGDMGFSVVVTPTGSSVPSGLLRPGSYLVQLIEADGPVWVRVGAFSASAPPVAVANAPSFPMDNSGGLRAFPLHVRKNHNDQVAAIRGGATTTGRLIITPTSRVPRV